MSKQKFGNVWYEKKEGIAFLTLDDQKVLNALSAGIRQGLVQSLDELENDEEVQVAIITGEGKTFCAGGDISGFDTTIKFAKKFLPDVIGLLHKPEKISKPIISAVNGLALGGGLELAISTDFIIASEKAKFGTPEPMLGLVSGFAVVRLGELVGRPRAKEIMMTSDQFSAEEVYRMGMINKVVPHEELMNEAIALAKRIMKNAPIAVRLVKSTVNRFLGGEDIAYALDGNAQLFGTKDVAEGVSAFMGKRKPVFKGE